MLKRLVIRNFALIEEIDITFDSNFIALTGETGSGKTIIIESLNLIFGSRADSTFIRDTNKSSFVEASFNIDNQNIIISRTIDKNGNNTIKYNNELISLAKLKDLSRKIGIIFSQNEMSYSLDGDLLLSYIDKIDQENTIKCLNEYLINLSFYHETSKKLQSLHKDLNANEQLIKEYNEIINELELLDIKINEANHLEERLKLIKDSAKIKTTLNNIKYLIDNEDFSIENNLYDIYKEISNIARNHMHYQNLETSIKDVYYNLTEIKEEVNKEINNIDFDEEEFNKVNERLYLIQKIMKKYDLDEEGLISLLSNTKEKLDLIVNYDNIVNETKKKLATLENNLNKISAELNLIRIKSANILKDLIIKEAKDLNLNGLNLDFVFTKSSNYKENGLDDLSFLVSFNEGEELKPFTKVSSGGEKSRMYMILNYILCKINNVKMIIFDEIDSGVSGKTALSVSNKLKDLSSTFGVICITHSPILASTADTHYKISKVKQDNKIVTIINKLSYEQRVEEIAYMISGEDLNINALNQARDMIKKH